MRPALRLLLFLGAVALLGIVGRPVVFLAWAWYRDAEGATPHGVVGRQDVSGLDPVPAAEVVSISADPKVAEQELVSLVQRAATESRKIAISGAQHSMGGHTLYPGGIALDMRAFRELHLDATRRVLTAGAGATWAEILPFLDHHGLSVAVMQSSHNFTVGGSLSVNCHGWQHSSPPIASTVKSLRLLLADGRIVRCSREDNASLFSAVLGGYGLFGVILDAELHVVPNEFYHAQSQEISAADYAREYRRLLATTPDVGLAYGRISVAPNSFLEEALIVLFRRTNSERSAHETLSGVTDARAAALNRTVFRASVGSDYGKNLRWWLETALGETGSRTLSRNQILHDPFEWFANRDPAATEILHEYFVPDDELANFLSRAKPVFQRHRPDLLNVTVREVQPDADTLLAYAREPVFGLVMLFHHAKTSAADAAMAAFTRELIEVALACRATYYLPYRPHATVEQFLRAYPMAAEFFAQKRRFDPNEVFQNEFYRRYAEPTPPAGQP